MTIHKDLSTGLLYRHTGCDDWRNGGVLIPLDEKETMLLDNPIPALNNATLSANCFGLTVTTKDGAPASFAIVDAEGKVIESGNHVAQAAWHLMIAARNNFLIGQGHLRVLV